MTEEVADREDNPKGFGNWVESRNGPGSRAKARAVVKLGLGIVRVQVRVSARASACCTYIWLDDSMVSIVQPFVCRSIL